MATGHDEIVGRARELAPTIAARAAATEAARTPRDDTIAELIDAELFSILVPERWGGLGLGLHTHREVVEIVSAVCMSTGWVTAFYSGHNWLACKFPEATQEEVFAGRGYAMIPITAAPTMSLTEVDGGVRVSGRSSWGTGVMHGDWVSVGGFTAERAYMVLLPISDVEVVDVWHMAAMSGTGSNDFVIDDVFVPEARTADLFAFGGGDTEGARLHDDWFRMPMMAFLHCEAIPVFVGGLRGAANAFEDIVRHRVTTHAGTVKADDRYTHIQLGAALAAANAAERLLVDQIDATLALVPGELTLPERARLKGQAGFVVDLARRAVNEMAIHAGTSNYATDSPIQRFFRDINMLATHAFWDWEVTREQVGRIGLDLDATTPLV
ncbi:MAG: acyl-CoA dehydrogenase family protein [Actinomycetota bacterium]